MNVFVQRLQRACEAVGVLLFALLFGVFVVQVTARLVWGQPLSWTDEAAVVLYTWLVLWGTAAVCRWREHVAFDLLLAQRAVRTQRYAMLLMLSALALIFAWALPGTIDYIWFMRRESTPVMGWPLHLVYAPFALMLLVLTMACVWRVGRLLGSRWREVVSDVSGATSSAASTSAGSVEVPPKSEQEPRA